MTDQTAEPIRKGVLPTTPPPEYEFHTAIGTSHGCVLVPSDAGPVVVRRRVTYGDWEPVRPDRWAGEPETDAEPAVPPPADRAALRQCIAAAVQRCAEEGDVRYGHIADAVLAVLPEPANQAAVDNRGVTYWQAKLRAVTEGSDHLKRENERLRKELANAERIRENADFHLGSEMARRQLAEKEVARLAAEAQPVVCVECGHPSGTHQEGEDPVTPGRCTACPDDDAWHDYHPAAARPDDTTGA